MRASGVGRRDIDVERARLAALVEHSGEAIVAVDRRLRVTASNPAAERLFGYAAEDAVGRPLAGILGVAAEDVDVWTEHVLGGEILRFDAGPGDGALCVAVTLAPVRGPEGEVIGAVSLSRDVTVERAAAADLEREGRRARFAARAAGLLTASLDRRSTTAAMNRLAVPELADLCAVFTFDRETALLRLEHVAVADPGIERAMGSVVQRPIALPEGGLATRVAATGEPVLLDAVPKVLSRLWKELYPELTEILEPLVAHSAMALPLRMEDELVGFLMLISLRADRRYDAADLAFAGEIAERIAQTLERVRLYESALAAKEAAEASERRLRAAHERFTAAFEHAPVGMVLIEVTAADAATAVAVNSAMCELTGFSRDELVGRDPVDVLVHPEDRADAHIRLAGLGTGTTSYRVERRYLTRGGEPLWVQVHVALIDGPAGPQVILQALDITERRRAEEALRMVNEELEGRVAARTTEVETVNRELEAANRELEAANCELEAFAYSAAHDLRAPLRAIDRFAATLADEHAGPLTLDGLHYVDLVRQGAREMSALIDDLLAFSRAGLQAMHVEVVDPAALVAVALAELEELRAGRAVAVVVGPLRSAGGSAAARARVRESARQRAEVHPRPRSRAHRDRLRVGPRRRDLLRARQRHRIRRPGCRADLQRVPPPAPFGGVRGHGRWPGACQAHRRAPRRDGLGRGRGGPGRDLSLPPRRRRGDPAGLSPTASGVTGAGSGGPR